MTKFFNKFKNHVFGPFFVHFLNLGGRKNFSAKSSSVTHNFIWVSSTMPKFIKKLIIQFQENALTDERMEGWTDLIS